jgi:hypothetical protein
MDVHRSFALLRMTILFAVLLLCGCRTEYVPIESVRYDSVMIEKLMRDSVFVRDSVYLKEKGDTVFKYKDRFVYVYKNRIDTFFAEKIREKEVPVPVERKLTWWEVVKMEWLDRIFAALIIVALYWNLKEWLARRTRKE